MQKEVAIGTDRGESYLWQAEWWCKREWFCIGIALGFSSLSLLPLPGDPGVLVGIICLLVAFPCGAVGCVLALPASYLALRRIFLSRQSNRLRYIVLTVVAAAPLICFFCWFNSIHVT